MRVGTAALAASLFAAVFFASSAACSEAGPIKPGDRLTVERCVETALALNPSIAASRGLVAADEGRLGQAKSPYYPQVELSAGYSRNSAPASSALPGRSNPYDQYTNGVKVTQKIYDFARTSTQVEAQSRSLAASRADLDAAAAQTAFNARQAFYQALRAERDRESAAESVKTAEERLKIARGFFEVGKKPRFDVTKAEADLSAARLALIRAGNSVKAAYYALSNAMGTPEAEGYSLEDAVTGDLKAAPSLDESLRRAFGARPELRSSSERRAAADEGARAAARGYYPELTGSASYNWSGERYPLDEGWSVGATVTMPLFSGFSTKYKVDEARASLATAEANERRVRQEVELDVKRALLALTDARESVPAAELLVRQAKESLDLASGRYAAGVGGPIEVADAEAAYAAARGAYSQALYDFKIAEAGLLRAMGEK